MEIIPFKYESRQVQVIQDEDGKLEIFPTDKAKEVFESMPIKKQRLYYKDYKKKIKSVKKEV